MGERMRTAAPASPVLVWESGEQREGELANHTSSGASVVLLSVEGWRQWWSLGQGANTGLSSDGFWSFAVDPAIC